MTKFFVKTRHVTYNIIILIPINISINDFHKFYFFFIDFHKFNFFKIMISPIQVGNYISIQKFSLQNGIFISPVFATSSHQAWFLHIDLVRFN
jgi:hypothetical protein